MRTKKAVYNAATNLLYYLVVMVSGLVLPRLIILHFGSDYNGIVASITQFVSYGALLVTGVAAAMWAALFKPLAEQDRLKISGIVRATEIFMRKAGLIFAVGLIVFAAAFLWHILRC